MKPAPFDYEAPASLDAALDLLARHGGDAKILAGGQSLIPVMNFRLAEPALLIDINRLAELDFLRRDADGTLRIGALTRQRRLERDPLVAAAAPLLHEAVPFIAHPQIRNRGTFGGSLAHADPAADYPAAIIALDADIDVVGPNGRRTIRADEFFVDLFQTSVAANEIIAEIRVPATPRTVAYVKTEQKASGFALAGVATVMSPAGVRVGVTGIAAKAYRATGVERALAGQATPAADVIARASHHAADGVEALGDIHGSAEYRAHLAQVNTKRALERALART
jgi:aerobic carbon-monoxide dehydrogenase medium subunit